jgi:hypothetical protein
LIVVVSYYNCSVEIHTAALKHGIAAEDIEHAVQQAMTIDDQDDDTRLYLGPPEALDFWRWSQSFERTDRSLRSTPCR